MVQRFPGRTLEEQLAARAKGRPNFFDLDAVERIGCAMLENGLATTEELVNAITKCSEEKPCQEEKSLIEQSYPLLLAGLAALTIALPVFRSLRALRSFAASIASGLSHLPWVGRFFSITASGTGAAATGASFEAAAAGLTPEYLSAVATSASILSRLQVVAKAEGVVAVLLAIAGYVGSSFDVFPSEPEA